MGKPKKTCEDALGRVAGGDEAGGTGQLSDPGELQGPPSTFLSGAGVAKRDPGCSATGSKHTPSVSQLKSQLASL